MCVSIIGVVFLVINYMWYSFSDMISNFISGTCLGMYTSNMEVLGSHGHAFSSLDFSPSPAQRRDLSEKGSGNCRKIARKLTDHALRHA